MARYTAGQFVSICAETFSSSRNINNVSINHKWAHYKLSRSHEAAKHGGHHLVSRPDLRLRDQLAIVPFAVYPILAIIWMLLRRATLKEVQDC